MIGMTVQAIVEIRRSGESFKRYMHRTDVKSIGYSISLEEAGRRQELKEWYMMEIAALDVGVVGVVGCRCCGKGGAKPGCEDGTRGFVFVEREKDVEKWAQAPCEKK